MSYTTIGMGEETATLLTNRIKQGLVEFTPLRRMAEQAGVVAPPAPEPIIVSAIQDQPGSGSGGSIVYIGLGVAALALGSAVFAKYRKRKAG